MNELTKAVAKLMALGYVVAPDSIELLAKVDMADFIEWLKTRQLKQVTRQVVKNYLGQLHHDSIECIDYTKLIQITATPQDWVKYFNSRYRKLAAIMKPYYPQSRPLKFLKYAETTEVETIALLFEIRVSKSGNYIWVIEDDTHTCKAVLTGEQKELVSKSLEVLPDAVIHLAGQLSDTRDMLFIRDIHLPDIPNALQWPEGVSGKIAFFSDTQIGNKYALEKALEEIIAQVKGIKDLRAVIHLGDLCDVVGVYPTQENELTLKTIHEQYSAAADYLRKLPSDIPIILIPGNHSFGGASNKLPAPAIPRTPDTEPLFKLPNVRFVSDPAEVVVDGKVRLLLTHGTSIQAVLANYGLKPTVEGVIFAMRQLLRHRHLCPMYGIRQCQLTPTEEDLLVIERVPNVFATGHIHVTGQGNYKGVRLLAVGGVQAETPYMKQQAIEVAPPSYSVLDLATGTIEIKFVQI